MPITTRESLIALLTTRRQRIEEIGLQANPKPAVRELLHDQQRQAIELLRQSGPLWASKPKGWDTTSPEIYAWAATAEVMAVRYGGEIKARLDLYKSASKGPGRAIRQQDFPLECVHALDLLTVVIREVEKPESAKLTEPDGLFQKVINEYPGGWLGPTGLGLGLAKSEAPSGFPSTNQIANPRP